MSHLSQIPPSSSSTSISTWSSSSPSNHPSSALASLPDPHIPHSHSPSRLVAHDLEMRTALEASRDQDDIHRHILDRREKFLIDRARRLSQLDERHRQAMERSRQESQQAQEDDSLQQAIKLSLQLAAAQSQSPQDVVQEQCALELALTLSLDPAQRNHSNILDGPSSVPFPSYSPSPFGLESFQSHTSCSQVHSVQPLGFHPRHSGPTRPSPDSFQTDHTLESSPSTTETSPVVTPSSCYNAPPADVSSFPRPFYPRFSSCSPFQNESSGGTQPPHVKPTLSTLLIRPLPPIPARPSSALAPSPTFLISDSSYLPPTFSRPESQPPLTHQDHFQISHPSPCHPLPDPTTLPRSRTSDELASSFINDSPCIEPMSTHPKPSSSAHSSRPSWSLDLAWPVGASPSLDNASTSILSVQEPSGNLVSSVVHYPQGTSRLDSDMTPGGVLSPAPPRTSALVARLTLDSSPDSVDVSIPGCDGSLTFEANPRPAAELVQGVCFGPLNQTVDGNLEFQGQFPDVVTLTRYPSRATDQMATRAWFCIESLTWNRLLTYVMWHGNSRIEAGPLDIAEAEDQGLGPWQIDLCVLFIDASDQSTVRLIAALRPSNPKSAGPQGETTLAEKMPSVMEAFGESERAHQGFKAAKETMVEIPHTHLDLPLTLSSLASALHEIHRVAQMTTNSSTSFSSSSLTSLAGRAPSTHQHLCRKKKLNKNAQALMTLSRAIDLNSKLNGERIADDRHSVKSHQSEHDKIMMRGKRWLHKKKLGLIGNNGGGVVVLGDENESHITVVDGTGLPLPPGATLVQPWDSDWV